MSENQGTTSTSPLTIPSFVLPQRPATALPSLGLGTNLSVSTPSSVSNSLPTTYSSIARIPQPLPQEARTTQTRSIARSASIPSIFKPLVKILEASRQEGVSMVSSSDLGTSLIRASPGIYERAGVMQLKKYIELAKEQGVVSCRTGANGNIWVGLAPRFVTG